MEVHIDIKFENTAYVDNASREIAEILRGCADGVMGGYPATLREAVLLDSDGREAGSILITT